MEDLVPERAQPPGGPVRRVEQARLEEVDGRFVLDGIGYNGMAFEGSPGSALTVWVYRHGSRLGRWDEANGSDHLPWYRYDDLDEGDDEDLDDSYRLNGQPVTGYVIHRTDEIVGRIDRIDNGHWLERMSLSDDGRMLSRFREGYRDGTRRWDDSQFWYESGRPKSLSSVLHSDFAPRSQWSHCSLGLEFDETTRLASLAVFGPYFDVVHQSGGWDDAWIVPSTEVFRDLSAAADLRLFRRLDRWWGVALEALAENGGLDQVETLSFNATSFDADELMWLTGQRLPALRSLTITARAYLDHTTTSYGDLIDMMSDLKRSRPAVEIRVGPIWITRAGEEPTEVGHADAVGYFDDDYHHLIGIRQPDWLLGGPGARSSDYLFEWLVAQTKLKYADFSGPERVARFNYREHCITSLKSRRPDVQLMLQPDA
jgi:hypothetical protein